MLSTYYLLQVIICSGILFLYYHVALRNRVFHQWNRFYLLAAVVLSVVLPGIDWNIEKPEEAAPVTAIVTALTDVKTTMEVVAVQQGTTFSASDLILPAYLLVCAGLLILLIASIEKILSIIRRHEAKKADDVYFIDADVSGTPFSFFKYIFWNRQIDLGSDTGQRIARHEMVHVREWHSLDKLLLQLLLVLFWINPFFWLIRRELRSIHEFIADQRSTGEEGSAALAAMILESSYQKNFSFITNQFFNTSIKRRIAMITKSNAKVNYFTRVLALPVIAFIAFAFTVKLQAQKHQEPVHAVSEPVVVNTLPLVVAVKDTVPHKGKPTRIDFLKNGKALVYFETGFEVSKWEWVVKDGYITQAEADRRIAELKNSKDPLIVYNGEVKTEHTEKSSDMLKKDASEIVKLPAEEAIAKYGEKGKNGALEIIAPVKEHSAPVFVKVEVEATIDKVEWRRFLSANILQISKDLAERGKVGQHTIMMQLLVEADGTVSKATTVDDLNLGIAQDLEAALLKCSKWNPAMQNGRKVRSYVKKPITFVVSEQTDSAPVYTQVDKPATVNGDEWRKFITVIMPDVIKESKYKGLVLTMAVNVQLLIGTDGRVHEAKVLNDERLGVERALEKALLASPLWEPAEQNGKKVRVYVNRLLNIQLNAGSTSSKYPETEPEAVKKMTIHQMLGVPATVEIISCSIAMDQPNGDIIEVKNTGNEFSTASRKLIATAQKELILTVDAILVKKDDGSAMRMPSRVYKM